MKKLVVVAKQDDRPSLNLLLEVCKEGACEGRVLPDHAPAPLESVALFASEDLTGIGRRRASARLAAHRTSAVAPDWATSAFYPVAVSVKRPPTKQTVKSIVRLLNCHPRDHDLTVSTPWGNSLPTGRGNFHDYCQWVRRAGLDPELIGLRYQAPVLSHIQRNSLVRELASTVFAKQAKKATAYAKACVAGAEGSGAFKHDDPSLALLVRLAKALNDHVVSCSNLRFDFGGLGAQFFAALYQCVSRSVPLTIIAPTCPPWDYDETGYTFGEVRERDLGVCYEMMIDPLEMFVKFLDELGVESRTIVSLCDLEWFDLVDGSYQPTTLLPKEEFMRRIDNQGEVILEDLLSRKLSHKVEALRLLPMLGEAEYLAARARTMDDLRGRLQSDEGFQRFFRNLLTLEKPLYEKQCGCAISVDNPAASVTQAALEDVVVYVVLIEMMHTAYKDDGPVCHFVQDDPFAHLCQLPRISWRAKSGAF